MSNEKKNFFIFLILLFFFYSLHFVIFNDFIISYRDEALLDYEIPNNFIVGQIFKGDNYIFNSLLGGEYKNYYFVRYFFLSNYLYSFLQIDEAYLIIDLIHRTLGYFFFYKLAYKISKQSKWSFLTAVLYSFISSSSEAASYFTSVVGFGIVSLPYLFYLSFKEKLKIKHFVVVFFLAIHSHFYLIPVILILVIFSFFYNNKSNLFNILKINFHFILFCTLVSSNILLIGIFDSQDLNRQYLIKNYLTLTQSISNTFNLLTSNPFYLIENSGEKKIFWISYFFNKLPYFLFSILSIWLIFFKNYEKKNLFIFSYILITLFIYLSYTYFYGTIINYSGFKLLDSYNLDRLHFFLVFLSSIILLHYKKNKNNRFHYSKLMMVWIIFIINLFFIQNIFIPAIKKYYDFEKISVTQKNEIKKNLNEFKFAENIKILKSLKKNNINKINNENVLGIRNFYDFNNFAYIKSIVKDEYVLPVNIKPMKLIVNGIKTFGGRFQIFPQKYSEIFKKIYSKELERINYYQDHLYINTLDEKNLKLDFSYAQELGIKYILSKNPIESKNLEVICNSCNKNNFYNLYLIKF